MVKAQYESIFGVNGMSPMFIGVGQALTHKGIINEKFFAIPNNNYLGNVNMSGNFHNNEKTAFPSYNGMEGENKKFRHNDKVFYEPVYQIDKLDKFPLRINSDEFTVHSWHVPKGSNKQENSVILKEKLETSKPIFNPWKFQFDHKNLKESNKIPINQLTFGNTNNNSNEHSEENDFKLINSYSFLSLETNNLLAESKSTELMNKSREESNSQDLMLNFNVLKSVENDFSEDKDILNMSKNSEKSMETCDTGTKSYPNFVESIIEPLDQSGEKSFSLKADKNQNSEKKNQGNHKLKGKGQFDDIVGQKYANKLNELTMRLAAEIDESPSWI